MGTDKKKRKKQPPPPKVISSPAVPENTSLNKPVDIISANADRCEFNKWLRRLAGTTYITTQESMTVAKLAEDPEFKGKVTLRSLARWCNEDKWVEERQKYFNKLEVGIRKQIEKSQIKSTIGQLKELDELSAKWQQKLNEAEPGTYEGMITSYLKLIKEKEFLRDKIAREVAPEGFVAGMGESSPQMVPDLGMEEARELAMFMIARRQKIAQRKLLEAKKNGEKVDPKS